VQERTDVDITGTADPHHAGIREPRGCADPGGVLERVECNPPVLGR